MAKSDAASGFWGEMLQFNLYKRNQGRLTRQLTAVAILVAAALGAYTLSAGVLVPYGKSVQIGVSAVIVALAAWFSFRLVNYPRFADFLISVQAEMDKVDWPSKSELIRSTAVVLATMLILGVTLFLFDLFWVWLFRLLGVLTTGT